MKIIKRSKIVLFLESVSIIPIITNVGFLTHSLIVWDLNPIEKYSLSLTPVFLLPIIIFLIEHNMKLKNIWRPFWRFSLKIDLEKYLSSRKADTSESSQDKIRVAIRDWAENCNIKYMYEAESNDFRFLKEKDALMFKLTWG